MDEFAAHQWDLDHPEEAAALYAARIEEIRALGIEIEPEPRPRFEIRDRCLGCNGEIIIEVPRGYCPDCA